jgi:uncharacterized protein (TIGR03790 family)
MRPILRSLLPTLVLSLCAGLASAQTAENVLVVINRHSAASVEIGEYYAAARSVPATNIVRLETVDAEGVARDAYETTIEEPVAEWLRKHSLQDRILYIVLTKGVPLRIIGTGGRNGTQASVDSELTLLYRRLVGEAPPLVGPVPNPLFAGDTPIAAAAQPITRHALDIYLVTRLDGFTVEDVLGLIDRGLAPASDGHIVLDQKATIVDQGGDRWLKQTADRLRERGSERVVLESTTSLAAAEGPVLGYYSWGSNDPANQLRRLEFSFAPGAIGGTFVSTDGRTFTEPPADWRPSGPNGGPLYGGSFQSLAGDLIRSGLTGVSAHVDEPFLDATIRPQILFPAYLAGFNLAESFYLAMPFLSWRTVVIGDPLCAPVPRVAPEAVDNGIDPETLLPALFSQRRLSSIGQDELRRDAIKLLLKSEALRARGEETGVEALLAEAAEIEPKLTEARFQLAARAESRGDHAAAAEHYREIVAVEPKQVDALTRLARTLGERLERPKEAVPFAERAYTASGREPLAADLVGWMHHLSGDRRAAAYFLDQAAVGAPEDPHVLIHLAVVQAALGNTARARAVLEAALKWGGAEAAGREDVKVLQEQLRAQ